MTQYDHWIPPFGLQTRKRSGFLLLPKTIQGITKFFEFATWEEQLIIENGVYGFDKKWRAYKWINNNE